MVGGAQNERFSASVPIGSFHMRYFAYNNVLSKIEGVFLGGCFKVNVSKPVRKGGRRRMFRSITKLTYEGEGVGGCASHWPGMFTSVGECARSGVLITSWHVCFCIKLTKMQRPNV